MSENLPVKSSDNPNGDFTMKDLEKIERFKENGLHGLHNLDPLHVERAMSMYIDGKSYRQIANCLKVDRTIIMFLSQKFKWIELRTDYLSELYETMKSKVLDSKLQSQEFLLHLTLAYQKKIGRDVDKYLRTDDVKHLESVDNKDLSSLLKIIELLHRLNAETYGTAQGDKALVSLNGMVGEGITLTKTGTNSVDITPKSPFSNKLKAFADMKRQQEKENLPTPKEVHDIKSEVENPKPNEKKNEETPA